MTSLPPFAPYPRQAWLQHLTAADWDALVDAWIALSQACIGLSDADFKKKTGQDGSVAEFVSTFVEETAQAGSQTPASNTASPQLLRLVFRLSSRLLTLSPPRQLLGYQFLSNFAKVFPKKHVAPIISQLFAVHGDAIDTSLTSLKKLLIPQLESGINGDLKMVKSNLALLNPLLHVSPHSCELLLAGSDFFDGLVICFRVMNPPLRRVIVTTIYLCMVGLAEAEPPKWAMLSDQLYALKTAADAHKQGMLNANDSLVPGLVSSTPLLKVLLRRADSFGVATDSFRRRVTALESFKNGPMVRPKRLVRRKVDKGKGTETHEDVHEEMHVHRMSQITQIQDLFPDLGAGFVSKCLDEYGDDVEQVVANLLGESLPPHLASADRQEPLSLHPRSQEHPDLAPRPTPPQIPTRHNVFDDDEFDRLAIDDSKISFGKRPGKSADELLRDKSTVSSKAAILSALAALDPDDDERDDTYDATDVGGTVDAANAEADGAADGNEEALFRAYQMDAAVFDRDAATRRGKPRDQLREYTGMTDEAIEGWALMLARNPLQKKRLEAKYAFSGHQAQLERTSWRASPAGSGAEDSEPNAGFSRNDAPRGRGRGRGRGGGGGGGGGGGRGGGNVAGPTGEKDTEVARRRKEASKSSRANHNRRDARAKKMARGGFPG